MPSGFSGLSVHSFLVTKQTREKKKKKKKPLEEKEREKGKQKAKIVRRTPLAFFHGL